MNTSPSIAPPPIFLVGPTAVGKSAVALRLAEKLGGEIISMDSMQVYRGMDIGTAKPLPAERQLIPHHLIDVVEVNESFNVARYVELARTAVTEIQSRGKVPIFCGGTGLYLKAYREGLGQAPPANAAVREQLAALPLAVLLEELREKDPELHSTIDQQNPRRVVRAVEVIRLTGRPFSRQRADREVDAVPARIIVLNRSPENLRNRIDRRVEEMFRAGFVEETKTLLNQGLEKNLTASQAIGYRQILEFLRGERGLGETQELVKQKTRQYAKRQRTWFRHQMHAEWLEMDLDSTLESTVQRIIHYLSMNPWR